MLLNYWGTYDGLFRFRLDTILFINIMPKANYDSSTFRYIGLALLSRFLDVPNAGSTECEYERFRASFGTSPFVCSILWNMIKGSEGSLPKHLLWSLFYLKTFSTERVCASFFRVTEKTFRKWVMIFIKKIGNLTDKVVSICIIFFVCYSNILLTLLVLPF